MDSQLKERKRHAFDSFCKKVLKNAARDHHKAAHRRYTREISIDSLNHHDLEQLYVFDTYFAAEYIFAVLDYDVVVTDEVLAQALNRLQPRKRTIILLSYFLDMPDREIGEALHMIRASVQYQRTRSLTELKKIIKEELDEV